jgi:hypothetical protein
VQVGDLAQVLQVQLVPQDLAPAVWAERSITCFWASNPLLRLWRHFWYYLWSKPTGLAQFNDQDLFMVRQTTEYLKRHGRKIYPMVKASRNDDFHTALRAFANQYARGVGYAYRQERRAQPSEAAVAQPPGVAG